MIRYRRGKMKSLFVFIVLPHIYAIADRVMDSVVLFLRFKTFSTKWMQLIAVIMKVDLGIGLFVSVRHIIYQPVLLVRMCNARKRNN